MNAAKCFWHKLLFVGILLTSIPTNCEILPTLIRSKSLLTMLIFAKARWWLWWHYCWLYWCNEGDCNVEPTWERLEERQTPPLRESLLEVWKEEGLFYDFQIFNRVQTSWREAWKLLVMFRSFSKLTVFRPTFGVVEGIKFKYWKLALNALWCLQPPAAQHPTTSPSEESMRNRVLVTASFSEAKLPPICGNQLRKAKKPGVARSETVFLSARSWCPSWKEGKLSNHAP